MRQRDCRCSSALPFASATSAFGLEAASSVLEKPVGGAKGCWTTSLGLFLGIIFAFCFAFSEFSHVKFLTKFGRFTRRRKAHRMYVLYRRGQHFFTLARLELLLLRSGSCKNVVRA